jgi:hypothetical protein
MAKANRLEGFLTVSQAARALEITSERIRQLARREQLACLETPLGRLIPVSEIERWRADRNRRKAKNAA